MVNGNKENKILELLRSARRYAEPPRRCAEQVVYPARRLQPSALTRNIVTASLAKSQKAIQRRPGESIFATRLQFLPCFGTGSQAQAIMPLSALENGAGNFDLDAVRAGHVSLGRFPDCLAALGWV